MQRVAEELYRSFRKHPRVDVRLLGLRTPWRWIGVRTTGFLARLLARLPAHARHADADVVLFSSMVTAALAPALRRRMPGVRLAAIAHGLDVTLPVGLYQWWLPRVFGALDLVLPVSSATAEACRRRGAPPERLHICHNGISVDRFATLVPRDQARRALEERFGLPPGAIVVTSVGRQVERKGSAWFVAHVLPALPAHVHYVIAGDGPSVPEIRARAEAAGLAPRVHLTGWVDDAALNTVLRGADLFVMPNIPVEGDMEGFGVVLMEAALSELYAVGARLEGIQDAIAEPHNGVLVPPGDAAAFAEAILRVTGNSERLRALGRGARAYVQETFSWPRSAGRYVDVLTRLARGTPEPLPVP